MTDDDPAKKPVALEERGEAGDGRRSSPSVQRNRDVVRKAFLLQMPVSGRVLEIASGTGEHGAHISAAAPDLVWTYSDVDAPSLESQRAWVASGERGAQLAGPLEIDTRAGHWGEAESSAPWDGIFCANMIHIAPFEAARGLISGAGRLLRPGGKLMLYGPFARNGVIAPSNARFSEDLKRRDESWGVRDLDLDIMPIAEESGLALDHVIEMPANNLSVFFRQTRTY